jgi:protoporphyrinogen oxidase
MEYDIIIIGAGLAGLYAAYTIQNKYPDKKCIILESNKKDSIGGRIGNDTFYGEEIVVGAGVGRKNTDKLLIKLLGDLNIKYSEFVVQMNYSKELGNIIDVKKHLTFLRGAYNKTYSGQTFKQFGTKILGKKIYTDFVHSTGYTDYENEDVYETLYHYQMEDTTTGWTALHINWQELVDKLSSKIGKQHIVTSVKVDKLTKLENGLFEVEANNNRAFFLGKQVIIATQINTVQKLIPKNPIYKEIVGQPFIYIYAKFDIKSSSIMKETVKTYTIVPGPLQKLIPISDSVYMIAYADNKNAELLSGYKENTKSNRDYFENELEFCLGLPENSLHIVAIKDYFWEEGTHYYKPMKHHESRAKFIKEAQHPVKHDGLFVVGEAVSRKHGWAEGALESVCSVLKSIK